MIKRYERIIMRDSDLTDLIRRIDVYHSHHRVASVVHVDGYYIAILEREEEEEY